MSLPSPLLNRRQLSGSSFRRRVPHARAILIATLSRSAPRTSAELKRLSPSLSRAPANRPGKWTIDRSEGYRVIPTVRRTNAMIRSRSFRHTIRIMSNYLSLRTCSCSCTLIQQGPKTLHRVSLTHVSFPTCCTFHVYVCVCVIIEITRNAQLREITHKGS